MKIYTKTGDAGETGLLENVRVPKHDTRLEAYGTIDELNAAIGMIVAAMTHEYKNADCPPFIQNEKDRLQQIQCLLFSIGTLLATPTSAKTRYAEPPASTSILDLEAAMDAMSVGLPELRRFILPGGTMSAATTHLARTISRRAERATTKLHAESPLPASVLTYMNRLSDYLFVLARAINNTQNCPDIEWRNP